MKVRISIGLAVGAVFLTSAVVRAQGEEHPPLDAVHAPDAPLELPPVLTLSWCLERARRASPTLAEAEAVAEAAFSRIGPAGAFDDPRIAYEASNIPTGDFDFRSTPLSGHQLGLRQKLPFPGLLSNRRKAATHSSEASSQRFEDRRLVVEGWVEMAWVEYAFSEQALGITNRNIELLRRLAETAESRYRVGTGLQQDVLRAQVELTALLQERLRREEAIERSAAALIELLDLPGAVELPASGELHLNAQTPALEPLLAELDRNSPRLRAAQEQVEAANARVRAAELEGLPEIDLGIGYRIRSDVAGDPVDGDDFFSAGFTLRLPIDRAKWRDRVAEQSALARGAKATLRGTRSELVASTRRAHAELVRASSEEILLQTGLVPQARQSLDASRSAYEVGRIEFLSVLDSQVRLLGAELRLARARADKRRAFASLEAAAGEKLR